MSVTAAEAVKVLEAAGVKFADFTNISERCKRYDAERKWDAASPGERKAAELLHEKVPGLGSVKVPMNYGFDNAMFANEYPLGALDLVRQITDTVRDADDDNDDGCCGGQCDYC